MMPEVTIPADWKYKPACPQPVTIKPMDTSPYYRDLNTPAVDMRPTIRRLKIGIRQQPRGNCATHAFIFLHEYMYATRLLSDVRDLSEEYAEYVAFTLFHPNLPPGANNFMLLDIGYQQWGLCPESLVPAQLTRVTSVPQEILDSGKKWARFHSDFIKNWDPTKGASQSQLEKVVAYLDQNIPVAVGLWWPNSFSTTTISGVDLMDVPSRDNVFDGHAVALVGYSRHQSFPSGGYFIFRNSWNGWGENQEGYGYMPFEYIRTYANDMLAYPLYSLDLHIGTIEAATWVHGTVVEAEYPERLVSVERKGWGSVFTAKAGTTNWFHISIATPVIKDGVRPQLTKVFCLYQAGSESMLTSPKITSLHLYDGRNKVKSFDELDLYGDHLGTIDESNLWHVSPPLSIHSGLNISVGVWFPSGPNHTYAISFAAAGADFNNS
jgi:hypothetical protein